MTEQELLKLKKQIDEASSKRSELKGQEKAILKQLKDECGAKSIEEAEKFIDKADADIEKLDKQLQVIISKIESVLDEK